MTANNASSVEWHDASRRFMDAFRSGLEAQLSPADAYADAAHRAFGASGSDQVAVTARLDQAMAALLDEASIAACQFADLDDVDASVALLFELLSNPTWGRFELAGGFAVLAVRLGRSGYRGDPRDGA